MDTSIPLPHVAPDWKVSAPLPSTEAIEAATDIVQDYGDKRIVHIGGYIVKYGKAVNLIEAENMLFVDAEMPGVVPYVYAAYTREDTDGRPINYIVMENIAGASLESLWAELTPLEKEQMANRLHALMQDLRGTFAPAAFSGSIGERPFNNSLFDASFGGLFRSEQHFTESLAELYKHSPSRKHMVGFYRQLLSFVLRGHEPVFSYSNFKIQNIIIRDDGGITLLDWERAGWYPEYWDYATAMLGCDLRTDDWHEYLGRVFFEYPSEYVCVEKIMRDTGRLARFVDSPR